MPGLNDFFKEKIMKRFTRACSILVLLSSCYKSHGPGDAGNDASRDPRADDVAAEETQQPFTIDFRIENTDPDVCSSCVYYLDFTYGLVDGYGLEITSGERNILWHPPDCVVACSSVEDPMYCCIDCDHPIPAVKMLVPGESVSVHWDGSVYEMNYEVCECGCHTHFTIGPGIGYGRVCAYSHYECMYGMTCAVDENGVIHGAEVRGESTCTQRIFSFPADSGGEILLPVSRSGP